MSAPVLCAYCGKDVDEDEALWVADPVNGLRPFHIDCAAEAEPEEDSGSVYEEDRWEESP